MINVSTFHFTRQSGRKQVTGGTGKYFKDAQKIIASITNTITRANYKAPKDSDWTTRAGQVTFSLYDNDPLVYTEQLTIIYKKPWMNLGYW